MKSVKRLIYGFMTIGILVIILSVVGLIIFNKTGLYFLHPATYFMWLIMGLGWTATAIASAKEHLNNKIE